MYKIIFLGILFFTIYSNQSLAINKFNTTITIHYEKEADKESTRFQQYERYALKDYGIIEAPKHSLEDEELKTVIHEALTRLVKKNDSNKTNVDA